MEFNQVYQTDLAQVLPQLFSLKDYGNAIEAFICTSANYRNGILRMEMTIHQRAFNMRVLDEAGEPVICDVVIRAAGYADILEQTDAGGFLSTDCAPQGEFSIVHEGSQTQFHKYDTDLLAGGILQYSLRDQQPLILTNKGLGVNLSPSDSQNTIYLIP